MTHRSRYPATLQHELKVRESSGVQKVVNLSVGVAATAAAVMVGALTLIVIPH